MIDKSVIGTKRKAGTLERVPELKEVIGAKISVDNVVHGGKKQKIQQNI